jgi:hypothetical protein
VGDVVILCWVLIALETALQKLDNTAQEVGLKNNKENAKYIKVSKKTQSQCKQIERGGGYSLERVSKAIPLQAWTGPYVSSRLRLPDFKTIGT